MALFDFSTQSGRNTPKRETATNLSLQQTGPLGSGTRAAGGRLFVLSFLFAKVAEGHQQVADGHQPSAGARKVAPVRARPFLVYIIFVSGVFPYFCMSAIF